MCGAVWERSETMDDKIRIEPNTVQETLIIPLFARKICSEHFPALFSDPEAERLCKRLDYDFASKEKRMTGTAGLFGALEVAQRQYDLLWEVKAYLSAHPDAAVVSLGCGLDDTFRRADNGTCRGYDLDLPDVIAIRDTLLPAGEREEHIACDLNDFSWMDRIDGSRGAVFFASGVFYYLETVAVRRLFTELAKRFPGGVLAFDSCNRRGAKMMTKTWLKEAGIRDVRALFSLEDPSELCTWSEDFAAVSDRSYMRGYRDIYPDLGFAHHMLMRFCDGIVNMRIVKIEFKR